jgi:hypothetical protein
MANKIFTPPRRPSGLGTFSNNLVGLQLVSGGGLTQGNFEFTTSSNEKKDRKFSLGTFSEPITLESLSINSVAESAKIFQDNFKVYPNYDLLDISNFTLYGSATKRISTSITKIISYFPAALEFYSLSPILVSGDTGTNIIYDPISNETTIDLDLSRIRNPFGIDFSPNSTRNLSLLEIKVSDLRNFQLKYQYYSLYLFDNEYPIIGFVPTNSTNIGILTMYIDGNPFSGQSSTQFDLLIRPNNQIVAQEFSKNFDEVEKFLLNTNTSPIYTASFNFPKENEDGTYYTEKINLSWPLGGVWNLDITSISFESYLTSLNEITESFDRYKTNLISRFLTTAAFKEFDTVDQKMEKILQIYGRSFDETRKYITALSFMTSVNYNVGNDIPSQLLKNLAQTLGWQTNISPITSFNFLDSVFGTTNNNQSDFSGVAVKPTPDELNYQFFRNLILNTAYLFKSKGTRRAIENLLKLIGAPEALVDFTEYVYLADQKINIKKFNKQFTSISGGTIINVQPTLEVANTFSILGYTYTGFTITTTIEEVEIERNEYPIDNEGYPKSVTPTNNYFFQIGSGWFESTPQHRALEQLTNTIATFSGNNPNYQTSLSPNTYGQPYLDRFRKLPYTNLGFSLVPTIDNNKSWVVNETGVRVNLDGGFNARYFTEDDKLVINVKNVDLFLNPAQGLSYDVWFMSRQYNFPIPNQGLNYIAPTTCVPNPIPIYPSRGGVDWTEINPEPKRKSFFEFAQTFWLNTINVRNRQYSTDGKTGGYPTLESIYWRYLESENLIGVENNNFTYQTMIDYVNGLGDYWIRLMEQMVPATTLWNTGTKYENSIFHRQKFAWKRQRGCEELPFINPDFVTGGTPPINVLQRPSIPPGIPPTSRPGSSTFEMFSYDCPVESTIVPKYPWQNNTSIFDFHGVLGDTLNQYLSSNNLTLVSCDLNTLQTEWYVDLKLNSNTIVQYPFFIGTGYYNPYIAAPSTSDWDLALDYALPFIRSLGYDFYYNSNLQIVIFNEICVNQNTNTNFELNVGINFNLICGN